MKDGILNGSIVLWTLDIWFIYIIEIICIYEFMIEYTKNQ